MYRKPFGEMCTLQLIQVVQKHINACFCHSEIIALCHMDIAVPHLIAKQVFRRIQLRHERAEGVTKIVVFEFDPQLAFDFSRRIFEGVDCLDGSVWQTVHKLRRGNLSSVQIVNEALLLFPQGGKLFRIFLPLLRQLLKVHFQSVAEIDGSVAVS